MANVRQKSGTPTAEDFRSPDGTPVVVDAAAGIAYIIKTDNSIVAIGPSVGGIAATAPGGSLSAGTLVFSNSNGVSFGINGSTLTGSVAAAAPSPVNFSAGTTSGNLGSVVFSNSNGVSFGLNGSTITGTVATNYQSQGAYLTTAMASNRGTDFVQATAAFAGTSASGTINSTGISVSIGPYITTGALSNHSHGVSFTSGSVAFQTLSFTNSNGISFNSGTQGIFGSHNAITTGRASTDAVGLNTAQTNATWTVNSSGLSLNAGGYAGTGFTTATTAGTAIVGTQNTAGLSMGVPAVLTTAMASNRGSDFVQATAAFAGTNASGTINSTGISVSVAAGGATLSGFEPFHLANPITTTYLPTVGIWYFQPFVAPQAIGSGRLNYLVSNNGTSDGILRASNGASFASNTTGTRSISYSMADSVALYSRGAGANSTRLDSFWSNTWSIGINEQVSVILTAATHVRASISATVSYIASVGSNGAYTTSQVSHNGSFSSGATAWGTSLMSSIISSEMNMLSGQMLIPMGFNTSIPAGHYWLAQCWSTASTTGGTSVQDILPVVNQVAIYGISSEAWRLFGLTASNASSQIWPGNGFYSAASAVPPASVAFTEIRSQPSYLTQYFNIVNIPV